MFIWWSVTCLNFFEIFQLCTSDGLFVCLSVCLCVFIWMIVASMLEVALFDQASPGFNQICILVVASSFLLSGFVGQRLFT